MTRSKYLKWILPFLMGNFMLTRTMGQSNASPLPTFFNVQSIMPTSPDAAMLGRFGEIPIGYYTGTANISIPIYTIEDKAANFSLPIVLRYHSSGVKVEDQAGICGLGWSLEAEGSIVQIINGKDDALDHITTDDPTGYTNLLAAGISGAFSVRPSNGENVWPCAGAATNGQDSYTTMTDAVSGDGQPDLYLFDFAGYSGKFFINPQTGQPIVLDQKIPITFRNLGGRVWQATTLDGNVFTFGAVESSAPGQQAGYFVNGSGYTSKLTTVQLIDGKHISFTYSPASYTWYAYAENYHDPYLWNLTPANEFGVVKDPQVTYNNVQYLTNITANDASIQFNYVDRADLFHGTPRRLNSIDITDPVTQRLTKTFAFYCDYFSYTDTAGAYSSSWPSNELDTLGKRLRLDSVKQFGYNSAGDSMSTPPYRFTYDNTNTLPLKTSYSQDFWGYYNGRNNAELMPDFTFMRDVGCTGYSYANIPLTLLNSLAGGNRSTDITKISAGILKQITYPTGGYTKLSYESNSFTNFLYPDQTKVNAAYNAGYLASNNLSTDVTSSPYIVPNSSGPVILHLNATISRGRTSYTFAQMQPSYIEVVRISNTGYPITFIDTLKMEYTSTYENAFNTNGYYSWQLDLPLAFDSNYHYVISIGLPTALGAQGSSTANASVTCSYFYYLLPIGERSLSFGGGLRVDSLQNFDQNGTLVRTKVFRYVNADGSPSGILMSPLNYIDTRPMVYVNNISNAQADWQIGYQNTNYVTSQGQMGFSNSASGTLVGYSRVEEIELAPNGTTNGMHVYYYHNVTDQAMLDVPDYPDLLNGSLVRDEIWNASSDTLVTNTYSYLDNYTAHGQTLPSYIGVKAIPAFYGAGPCNFPGGSVYNANDGPVWDTITYTYVHYYPIVSHWWLPQSKTTNHYYNNTSLTTTESYLYNTQGQHIETDSYNSKGQPEATQYIYASDTTGVQAQLVETVGLLNSLLEQRYWVNGNMMTKTDFIYGIQAIPGDATNQVVRDSVVVALNGNSPYTQTSYNQYGPYETIEQVARTHDTTALIWDYHAELPIAEATNATEADIAYTSFEADGSGNWTIPDTTRVRTGNAMTGRLSYALKSSNTITSQTTNAAKTYVVSYWSMNGAVNVNGTTAVQGATVGAWTYYEHKVSGGTSISVSGTATIDELRLFPQNSLMKTYTYVPLIGMSSECSPTNYITYYTYDGLGRLAYVKDLRGNIIKTFQYHYQGQ